MKISKRVLSLILSTALLLTTIVVQAQLFNATADDTVISLRRAVTDFVAENGNSVTRASLLGAVQTALDDDTITLEADDYYFKHAVNGATDEDEDETTRINISGSDGALAAVFTVKNQRIGAVASVKHTVENLGTYKKVYGTGDEDPNNPGYILVTEIKMPDSEGKYKVILPENTSRIKINYNERYDVDYGSGKESNVSAIVALGHAGEIKEGYCYYTNLEVFQVSDNIKFGGVGGRCFRNNSKLKYVHLPENTGSIRIGWQAFINCTSLINLNIPEGITTFEQCVVYNTGLREIILPSTGKSFEPGSNGEAIYDATSVPEGEEGRNVYTRGSSMSFAQAAAYAQAGALEAGAYYGDTEVDVAERILEAVVYPNDLKENWNGTFKTDSEKGIASGTLTLTDENGVSVDISYASAMPENAADSKVVTAAVEAVFEAYVSKNGNSVTRTGLLNAVKSKVNALGYNVKLNDEYFYIKHAVDGATDEDEDETTRINIPGSDGVVVSVFEVCGQRIALTKVIKHNVENLGTYKKVYGTGDEDPNNPGYILVTEIKMPDSEGKYKVILPENTSRIKINYNERYDVDYGSGKESNVSAIVALGHAGEIKEGYCYYTNLEVFQVSDNIKFGGVGGRCFRNNSKLKYVHLPENTGSIRIGWQAFINCTSLINLNIPEGITTFEQCVVYNTGLREIILPSTGKSFEPGSNGEAIYDATSVPEGEEGRNVYTRGSSMSFAQAAAYAQAGALEAGAYYGDTEVDVAERILEAVVYPNDLKENWNGTFKTDSEKGIASGTLTLTDENGVSVDISYASAMPENAADSKVVTAAVEAVFEAYVSKNGNSVTRTGLLNAVKSKVNALGYNVKLNDEYFYIKHAVDGATDEDEDETTRINIPGSDGVVVSVFEVCGQRIALTKVIKHKVDNYGKLAVAEVSGTLDENGDLIVQNFANTDANTRYKVILPENTAYVDHYYSGGTINNLKFEGGNADNIVAMVVLGNSGTFKWFRAFSGLEVFQMSDDIAVSFGSSGNFMGLSKLKYVHLSDKISSKLPWQFFQNCSSLINVNIPSVVTEIENDTFTGTGLREIEYGSNVAFKDINDTFNNTTVAEGEAGRNITRFGQKMSYAKAAAYAIAGTWETKYTVCDDADAILTKILSKVTAADGIKFSWNDSFGVDTANKVAFGTVNIISADGDVVTADYRDEYTMADGSAEIEYLEFDTADKAMAIKINSVNFVTEVGVEVEIVTADGTKTIVKSTDYANAAAYGKKAFIALADKVYYVDISGDGEVNSKDMVALKKLLLGISTASGNIADLNGNGKVDLLDMIRLKKIMSANELEFGIAYDDYTYAFSFSDTFLKEDIESVRVKPYCIQSGEKIYGETKTLTQFTSDYTPVVKP